MLIGKGYSHMRQCLAYFAHTHTHAHAHTHTHTHTHTLTHNVLWLRYPLLHTQVSLPALIVYGEKDKPGALRSQTLANIPGSTTFMIPSVTTHTHTHSLSLSPCLLSHAHTHTHTLSLSLSLLPSLMCTLLPLFFLDDSNGSHPCYLDDPERFEKVLSNFLLQVFAK